MRFFASGFFHGSVSPQPQSIPLTIPAAYLPPVSTTTVKLVAKFATGVVDTGGKFAAGVVDTGGVP
jgi:hypothetical protein